MVIRRFNKANNEYDVEPFNKKLRLDIKSY
jgi:hypothetical protein